MAVVSGVSRDAVSDELKGLYDDLAKQYGRTGSTAVFAWSPTWAEHARIRYIVRIPFPVDRYIGMR